MQRAISVPSASSRSSRDSSLEIWSVSSSGTEQSAHSRLLWRWRLLNICCTRQLRPLGDRPATFAASSAITGRGDAASAIPQWCKTRACRAQHPHGLWPADAAQAMCPPNSDSGRQAGTSWGRPACSGSEPSPAARWPRSSATEARDAGSAGVQMAASSVCASSSGVSTRGLPCMLLAFCARATSSGTAAVSSP